MGRRISLRVIAFTPVLAALALFAIVVGIHDAALEDAGLSVTGGGVLLVAIGIAQLVAAGQLVGLSRKQRWEDGVRPPCSRLVLAVFIVTVLLGVAVTFSAIRRVSAQWPIVLVVGLALIAFGVLGLRFFGREATMTLARAGTISLGLIGTLVAAWQFWYQHEYVPAHAGRAVTLTAQLEEVGERGDSHVIRATVGYEGAGGESVAVIGSTYTLTGSRVVRCRRPAEATRVRRVFRGFLVDPQRSRFMSDVWEIQPATVLAAGKFVGDGKRLDENVSGGRSLIFLVPRGRHQLLRFRAQLFAIPASVQLSARRLPEYATFSGDSNLYGFWYVEDDSWLHDLIYGRERWVVIRYALVRRPQTNATSPDLRVIGRFSKPTWQEGRPSRDEVERMLAEPSPSEASEPFAGTELALEDAAEPTVAERRRLRRTCVPE